MIDATIVSVPTQRNRRDENEAIKARKTPEGWEDEPAKNSQKDKSLIGNYVERFQLVIIFLIC